jgi:hypothetical protein
MLEVLTLISWKYGDCNSESFKLVERAVSIVIHAAFSSIKA